MEQFSHADVAEIISPENRRATCLAIGKTPTPDDLIRHWFIEKYGRQPHPMPETDDNGCPLFV